VISIPLPAGSELLNPGDRVDVILTQTFKGDAPAARRSVSETVAEDLRVLAGPKAEGAGSPRSIDLEVSPQQAQTINVATELGKLSLALRGGSQADDATAVGPTRVNANYRKPIWAGDVSAALADAVAPPKPRSAGDVSAALADAVAPPKPRSELTTIEIIRGNGGGLHGTSETVPLR
jgi:pilus assembly protein CpaB